MSANKRTEVLPQRLRDSAATALYIHQCVLPVINFTIGGNVRSKTLALRLMFVSSALSIIYP